MSASPVSVIHKGHERARTAPWRGHTTVAMLTPTPDNPLLSPEFVTHCLETLAGRGFDRVVTSALTPLEQTGFLAAGFGVEQDLRLLSLDLGRPLPPTPSGPRLRRVSRRIFRDVLATDAAAFSEFWRFDELALRDALAATPEVRFRAVVGGGYVISGQAGRRGYVQRLAVHPHAQGRGLGKRLLIDGLHWMVGQGATRAMVNTQASNHTALSLYTAVGFEEEPAGLSVLSAGLS